MGPDSASLLFIAAAVFIQKKRGLSCIESGRQAPDGTGQPQGDSTLRNLKYLQMWSSPSGCSSAPLKDSCSVGLGMQLCDRVLA